MIPRTPARKALRNRRGGDGSRVGQGGSQSVGWAATGRYGRYTRDIWAGRSWGGWLQDLVLHSYTHNSTCCLGGDFSVDLVEMVMRMGWMMMRSRFP